MQQLDERLSKTVDNLKQKFQTVRTGRANPDLLSKLKYLLKNVLQESDLNFHILLVTSELHNSKKIEKPCKRLGRKAVTKSSFRGDESLRNIVQANETIALLL